MCWIGYVSFRLGGYEQPGSKENKGNVKDSSWREIGFAIALVCMYNGKWWDLCERWLVLVRWQKWDNKVMDETGLP